MASDDMYICQVNLAEQCDLCDESTVFRCEECRLKLCNACSNEHRSLEPNHDLTPHVITESESRCTSAPCKFHQDRKSDLFCQDCEVPVCQLCIDTGRHGDHNLKNIDDLFEEKRKIVHSDTKEMENILENELKQMQKRLRILVSTSPSKYEDLEKIVLQRGKKWHDAVEKVVKTFIADIENMKQGEKGTLQQLTQEIENLISCIQDYVKSNKEALDALEAEKILRYKIQADDLRGKIPEIVVPTPSFTEFEVAESKLVHENFGVLKSKVMSIDDERRSSQVLTESHSTVKLMESLKQLSTIETGLSAVYGLTCLENSELWVHGTDNSIVRIDRKNRKLERVKTVSFDGNVGISVNPEKELVYTDYEDCSVNIMKKSHTHAVIRLQGWKPRAVCFTMDGDMLVSMCSEDEKRARVMKYRNTQAIQEYYHDPKGRPLFPSGDTALYIAENKNSDVCVAVTSAHVVVVLSASGTVRFKYSDKTGKKEFRPMGLATDSQCHILMADYFNSRVQVVDKNGKLLRNIEGHGIHLPLSVNVCNYDNIYIGDSTGKIKQIKHLQ